ncbi:MAG: peptidylprolyl isomerase, partial [Candidatus Symbiothrix sp.]|nr:peptidylprolyl isomerase [Candidatus Symbiothrix sp.]
MKQNIIALGLMAVSVVVLAQTNDPVVMTINGKDVKKSEFEYIYNKNNNEDALDKRSLDEYITLFRNFKLRVAEAETQGLDTTAAFHKELNEYRSQLAKSYLETEKNPKMVEDAYKRAGEWSEISAIFVNFPQLEKGGAFNLTPVDTSATYNKTLEIRNKALKKGANFEDLVKEYTFDERSKAGDRPGYLGWYSGLKLAPVLENALTATPAGKITMPIRTPQGYYILKVHNKKLNPGEVNAAHILISTQPKDTVPVSEAEIKAKVDTIMQKLKAGADFGELAKEYSQDPGSAQEGGNLSWFGYGQMVPEFNEAVFDLKEIGDISQPV